MSLPRAIIGTVEAIPGTVCRPDVASDDDLTALAEALRQAREAIVWEMFVRAERKFRAMPETTPRQGGDAA